MKIYLREKMRLLLAVIFILFQFGQSALHAQIIAELERQYICKGDCIDWEPNITQGTAPFTFAWSTGEDEMKINLCPESSKSYMLTITDANQNSLVLSEAIIVAPVDRKPSPSVTTPMCVGETAYFYHPNWGHSPEYHWIGPNGNEFFTKDPIIDNIETDDAGEYFLYLTYYDICVTDTISVFLEVEDIGSRTSCEALSQCNFACNNSEIFGLRGRTTAVLSGGLQPPNFCTDDGSDAANIEWFGFVAQGGDHTIRFRAINCEGDVDGLRFGIYDGCDFTNLLLCTETCSKDLFEIPSSILVPGNSYYAYAEGCGTNICDYSVSIVGSMQAIYCNDYVPFSTATDWKVSVGGQVSNSTFWYNYLRDTTINNKTYRMIGVDGAFSYNGLLLREDEQERKVYYYNTNSNTEGLHYDFDLEIGDEYIDPSFNSPFIVTEITLVPSNIGPLRRWKLVSEIGSHAFYYTEAIGGNYLGYPADILISDPTYYTPIVFSNCTPIIENEQGTINTYRSEFDTTYVSICEGEAYMGYTESIIINDTLSQDEGCYSVETINLEVIPMGGIEIPYNGLDDDCNPETPDDDIDGDGFVMADDCDDNNAAVNPDGIEVPYNGIDEDCNGATLDDDLDQDGFVMADDCDDNNAAVNPDGIEVPYNGLDEDCDQTTLDDDLDQDGFVLADDCNDDNADINPSETEVPYNGIDEDCDETTLDDDLDQDGFVLADDCNDDNADINPSETEVPYNGIDEDCDETTLDDDLDQDGFVLADDCDDNNAAIYPDAVEIPNNGIDEDCDGEDLVLSTHEINNIEIKVYPNPVAEELFLDINGNLEYDIKLYNLKGQLVFSASNTRSISTETLSNGIYILKFQDLSSASHFLEKIIVSK